VTVTISTVTAPVLICQGFHRAFVEPEGPMFSASAAMRRATCESVLRQARRSGWIVVHTFLDTDVVKAAGEETIPGFEPTPSEQHFWQPGLSAFSSPPFRRAMFPYNLSPVFLISFAGLGAIGATLLGGLDRHFAMHVVTDAVADAGSHAVDERERLRAIETLARAHDSAVTSRELATLAPAVRALGHAAPHLISQAGR
jgi:Isochorismatase family